MEKGESVKIKPADKPVDRLHDYETRLMKEDDEPVVAVVRDITDRKQTEAALKKTDSRFRRAFDSDMIGMLFWNTAGKIVDANEAFLRIVGYTRDDVRAGLLDWYGMTPPEYRTLDDNALREVAATGVCAPYEKIFLHRDGSRVPIMLGAASLPAESGMGVAFVIDITARRKAEMTLQALMQEKEALIKENHHRVKGNLQLISSMLRLHSGRVQHPEAQSVLLNMQNRVYAMALIHEQLYRAENLANVDLADYLKQLCAHLVHALVALPQVVELRQDIATVRVGIDQAIPCGLLVNELLSNALKHAFPGSRAGEVSVVLQPVADGPLWRLRVADNGVGLPTGFELQGLTSVGLQLAPALARQIGGKLEIGPGPGTVFEVVFAPVVAEGLDHRTEETSKERHSVNPCSRKRAAP